MNHRVLTMSGYTFEATFDDDADGHEIPAMLITAESYGVAYEYARNWATKHKTRVYEVVNTF